MVTCQVLLVGGIGSGKSSVARLLVERGAVAIDADLVGHEVLREDDVIDEVRSRWPSVVCNDVVDRQNLADIVFSDPEELIRLESITHPRMRRRLAEAVAASESEVVVIEMPLMRDLVEGDWLTVVVDAPDTVRLERLRSRGMSHVEANLRMSSQPPRMEYLENADLVVDNSGTLDALCVEVERLARRLDSCEGGRLASRPGRVASRRTLPE